MSDGAVHDLETILARVKSLGSMVWGLLVAVFLAGGWATTLQFKVTALEARAHEQEASIKRIEFYVVKIAEKVGVSIEPPR